MDLYYSKSLFRYAQTVSEPFHISKACVEPSSLMKAEGKDLTSVYLENEIEEFLLCTLGSNSLNEDLDLNFNRGEKICVRTEVLSYISCSRLRFFQILLQYFAPLY
jgi:hypothetical protein